MRPAGIFAAAAILGVLSACGSSSNEPTSGGGMSSHGNAVVRRGCSPEGVAAQFGDLLNAVSERRQTLALQHIASAPDLLGVTVYHGTRPGEGRVDAKTPRVVFRTFAATIPAGEETALLAIGVGEPGPFAGAYEEKVRSARTAGVEVVARIGAEALSGKIGVDCETGRMYVGAMQVAGKLHPQRLCGKYVRIDAQKPLLCRL